MKDTIRELIEQGLKNLQAQGVLPAGMLPNILVENTKDKAHGDFASNIALVMAKLAGMKPRDLAMHLLDSLPKDPNITDVQIAGPGFLNFFQSTSDLAKRLEAALADKNIGVIKVSGNQIVVVDLSSPNLAKEMHVGHLRSTIIGDSVARVLELLGDTVIRQNHVGDWGTQFGMLLAFMEQNPDAAESELADLEGFYRASKERFDQDEAFADRARALVVKLQADDPECIRLWKRFNDISLSHCQKAYDRLGAKLTLADVKGESAYNNALPGIIDALNEQGLLTESDGAKCVFLDGYTNTEGNPLPLIVQKAGGGYLYATTDLAAMQYRSETLKADRALYFVDQRQGLHFKMAFELARKAGFVHPTMDLEHMGFGTMNDADGRPFRTRDGGTVKLIDLLDEAEVRAYDLVKAKNPDLNEQELREIATVVGISSVKYADLSKHRASDYCFNFDQMLSFEGNTAPYLLYAYTRVAGIFRKLGKGFEELEGSINLQEPQELALAGKLALFSDALNSIGEKGTPHLLCTYLFELAGLFSSFYEQCKVLNAGDESVRKSRLLLCALTGRILKQGMELLGLETLERM